MNIALIGYGKMGKEIDRIAGDYGVTVGLRLDVDAPPLSEHDFGAIDAAIHFAVPSTVVRHVEELGVLGTNVVIGTTGWYDELERVKTIAKDWNIGIVYGSNFSLGVNAFFHLIRKAGRLLNAFPEYDAFIHEIHHREKIDAPSGTALTLGNILLTELHRKTELLTKTPEGKIRPEQLQVSSTRGGSVVGSHSVVFDSPSDNLEFTHRAKNRTGFARGALLAAEWIRGKKGLFTMDDLFADVLR